MGLVRVFDFGGYIVRLLDNKKMASLNFANVLDLKFEFESNVLEMYVMEDVLLVVITILGWQHHLVDDILDRIIHLEYRNGQIVTFLNQIDGF